MYTPPHPTPPHNHPTLPHIRRRPAGLQLKRNEVIALMNLLHRLSLGVEVVRDLSLQLAGRQAEHPQGLGAIQEVTQGAPLPEQLRQ